jgi:hypothetical protein
MQNVASVFRVEKIGMFLQKTGHFLSDYTVSRLKGQYFSSLKFIFYYEAKFVLVLTTDDFTDTQNRPEPHICAFLKYKSDR